MIQLIYNIIYMDSTYYTINGIKIRCYSDVYLIYMPNRRVITPLKKLLNIKRDKRYIDNMKKILKTRNGKTIIFKKIIQ